MFKRPTAQQIVTADNLIKEKFPEASLVENIPTREFMIKWLNVFAPDMTLSDANSFCLPKLFYKNYVWNAFSYQKTDAYIEEVADEAAAEGFSGKCYILMGEAETVYALEDGSPLTPETIKELGNATVFDADFTKTYVSTGRIDVGPFYKSIYDEEFAATYEPEPEEFAEESDSNE